MHVAEMKSRMSLSSSAIEDLSLGFRFQHLTQSDHIKRSIFATSELVEYSGCGGGRPFEICVVAS